MVIRRASEADLPIILEGCKQFCAAIDSESIGLRFDAEKAMPFLRMLVLSPAFLTLVADEGVVIGGISLAITPWFGSTDQFTADEVLWWVFPEHRGGMAGVRVQREAEREAKAMGCAAIFMSADEAIGADKVERFYLRSGYGPSSRKYAKRLLGE